MLAIWCALRTGCSCRPANVCVQKWSLFVGLWSKGQDTAHHLACRTVLHAPSAWDSHLCSYMLKQRMLHCTHDLPTICCCNDHDALPCMVSFASDLQLLPAEPLLLVLNADGTLSGCSMSQRVLSTLWTVPGTLTLTLKRFHIWCIMLGLAHMACTVSYPTLHVRHTMHVPAHLTLTGHAGDLFVCMAVVAL